MEEIKLPIKEDKKDQISPLNPDFWWLWKMIIIIIPIIIISYLLFYFFAHFIIWNISIEKERELFWDISEKENMQIFDLKSLKNEIEGLNNTNIYIEKNNEINAYAIIWWDIILTTWLLENIENEEELIFIIWHENEHIKNRDVLQSLLTDIPFYLTMQFLWFNFDNKILNITKKYSSKTTEIKADNWWIELINKMNLNLNCSLIFFEKENKIFDNYLQLISDHPTNINRIKNIKNQNWNNQKKCTPFIYN